MSRCSYFSETEKRVFLDAMSKMYKLCEGDSQKSAAVDSITRKVVTKFWKADREKEDGEE